MQAYLLCLRLYGDPRGRSSTPAPILLFLCWRIDWILRLSGLPLQAELFGEVFDATVFVLSRKKYTSFDRLYDEMRSSQFSKQLQLPTQEKIVQVLQEMSSPDIDEHVGEDVKIDSCFGHPFTHWTSHQFYLRQKVGETGLLLSSLTSNALLPGWLCRHLPCFGDSGERWFSAELAAFSATVEAELREFSQLLEPVPATQDATSMRSRRVNPSSSERVEAESQLVRFLEADPASFQARGSPGYGYCWGSNGKGQLGSVISTDDPNPLISSRQFYLFTPRVVLPLKDFLVRQVSCGFDFCLALLQEGRALSWGNNRSGQLGIGVEAVATVPFPVPILGLDRVRKLSAGNEHSAALAEDGSLFTWGQGDGGLLGLGSLDSAFAPREVRAFTGVSIRDVVCGGLHTLLLTHDFRVFSWGRGEGGQLGLPRRLLTETKERGLFLASPACVESLRGFRVVQVGAGDAHSLALEENGRVFAWGFSSSGQLGLGLASAEEASLSDPSIQVCEPREIPNLEPVQDVLSAEQVFCGPTFSFFKTRSNHILGCGINDFNQLAVYNKTRDASGKVLKAFEFSSPQQVDLLGCFEIESIACGANHSIAKVSEVNVLISWGCQKQGQLGQPATSYDSSLPQLVPRFREVAVCSVDSADQVGCGGYSSAAVVGEASTLAQTHAECSRKSAALAEWLS